jgi:hypothetical protein
MSDLHRDLTALEATPLLGRHLGGVRRALGRLAVRAVQAGDREAEARLLALGATLATRDGAEDARARLATATRAAGEAGDLVLEDRLALLSVRVLARDRHRARARDLLADVQGRAQRTPALAGDVALARAAAGFGDARAELEAALAALPSPARDHDRLDARLDLAERLLRGAGAAAARAHLADALAIGRRHDAAEAVSVAAGTLAALALEAGHPTEAAPLLDEALAAAEALDDDLGRVAHGTVRAALCLAAGDPAHAARVAGVVASAARRRNNWIAVADAILTQSCADPLPAAVERLVRGGRELQSVSEAAANLLAARLGELRAAHGEVFEAAFAVWVPGEE